MRMGAVQSARRSASMPCRSLPSSSAQGEGSAEACTGRAPATVSSAKTGMPWLSSSRTTPSDLSAWLQGTWASAPMAARPVCPRLSPGVAVYPQRCRWRTRRHSAVRKIAPTLKAERRLSSTATRGMRVRSPPGAPGTAGRESAPACESARPRSSGRRTRNSSSLRPRVCCRSTGRQMARKCLSVAVGASFGASEPSSRNTPSS
mmetsp:Transcript_10811/g.32553  ORF Transcript_10811/g.32553 Transcript_10811/m.32553 type:complete len:204 (-) Transcript_10811:330-941(-)